MEDPEIFALGIQLFNTSEDFTLWMITPNFALGSKKPIDLLKHLKGKIRS